MRLEELVAASTAIGATRARSRKVAIVAETLARLAPTQRRIGLSYLAGVPRQDRLDVGPGAVYGIDVAPADASTLELTEVDASLQAIADVPSGGGSRARRVDLLGRLLARATADEQDWLRRLVLRELRQGALEGVLVAAIATATGTTEEDVRRAAMLTGDVREAGRLAFEGGSAALRAVRLRVGTPIAPMLAATATDLSSALGGTTPVAVEAKLDGARVQLHRDGDHVAVFTRALNDVTDRVPELVAQARGLPARRIVLDGEALLLDADGRPRPFQETMSRFGRSGGGEASAADATLEVRWFDVLHLDDDDLLDEPLTRRLEVLDEVVTRRWRTDRLVTADEAQLAAFLRSTLAAGHEGVMVKDLDAPYAAGRRGATWRKLKPVHTLDLVVLAAEWGSGRRTGWLSNLHLGARDPEGGFVMLGKTFKGLTDETLAWQTDELLARKVRADGHVVHVRPELVVEIAFDGLVRSSRYPGGLALRFARVRGYRPDRTPADADTIDTVKAIHAGTRLPLP